METTITRHDDGTFTEYDADGNEIGYGDWRDEQDIYPMQAPEDLGYCTRCRRDDTDARLVYYPISDDTIQLCTNCEPDDVAVSPFELWHVVYTEVTR